MPASLRLSRSPPGQGATARILDRVLSRFARWYDAHHVAGDAWLAVLLLAFVVPSDLAAPTDAPADLAFSMALVACVPWRRRAPVAVFAVVGAVCLAQLALLDHVVSGDVVALIALYTIVAYGPGTRIGSLATACAAATALAGAIRWKPADVALAQVAATMVVSVLLAAALGAWRRSRQDRLAVLEERNQLLALERDQQAAVGAAAERARIARDLHDVVAHSLSVIVVQADGAAAAAERRPEAAAAALRTIGDTGREALTQMRRLLGVLREGRDGVGAPRAPQPGAAQLEELVGQVARAGLPVRLTVQGSERSLASAVDITLYRVAQEALTNVLKHADAVSRVDVVVRYLDEAVELRVHDDGRDRRTAGDSGHGLMGMRERVDLHGGTLVTGPAAGGGFAVRAVIPTAERIGAPA
jgi:signal transduction histidine kinase